MAEDALQVVRDYIDGLNSQDLNKILSCFTDDCVYEDLTLGTVTNGIEELKAFIEEVFVTMPDCWIELKSLFCSGDWVGYEWIFTATPAAPSSDSAHPTPGTGEKVSIPGASIAEMHEGKIKRNRDYGVLPPQAR